MNRTALIALILFIALLLLWRPWAVPDPATTDPTTAANTAADEVVGGGASRGLSRRPRPALAPQSAGVYLVDGTRAPHFHPIGSGPEVLYDNTVSTSYYLVGDAFEEWIDEFQLEDQGDLAQQQLNGIEFSYCSEESDPARRKGEVTLRIYDEVVTGRAPGDLLAEYQLTGLPLGGPDGQLRCWKIHLDLAAAGFCDLPLPEDGSGLGLGIQFSHDHTGPLLATGAAGKDPTVISPQGMALRATRGRHDFALRLFGPGQGIQVYAARDPGPADRLVARHQLLADGRHRFEVLRPRRDRHYTLLIGAAPTEQYQGEGSRLLDPGSLFQDGVVAMDQGNAVLEAALGREGSVFAQVVEHVESSWQAGAETAWSQGMMLYASAADFLAVDLPGEPTRPGTRGDLDLDADPAAALWWARITRHAPESAGDPVVAPTPAEVEVLRSLLGGESDAELQVAAVLALAMVHEDATLAALIDDPSVAPSARAVAAALAQDASSVGAWTAATRGVGVDPLVRRGAALGAATVGSFGDSTPWQQLRASRHPLDRATSWMADARSQIVGSAEGDAWIQARIQDLHHGSDAERLWAAAALVEAGAAESQRAVMIDLWSTQLVPLAGRARDPWLAAVCACAVAAIQDRAAAPNPEPTAISWPAALEQNDARLTLSSLLAWAAAHAEPRRRAQVLATGRVPGAVWPAVLNVAVLNGAGD